MGPYAGYLIETFVTLMAVCGLAFVVLYGARRLGIGRPRGPIVLVGQLPLDARRAVYLVQVGGQVLVIGASEAGLTKLGEVSAKELPEAEADVASGAPPFGDVLARVLGTRSAGRSQGAKVAQGASPEAQGASPEAQGASPEEPR